MLPQNGFIFILFYDFYRKTYGSNKVNKVSINKEELNNNVIEVNDELSSNKEKTRKEK